MRSRSGRWAVPATILALGVAVAGAAAEDSAPTAAACQPANIDMIQRNFSGEIVDTYVARFSELRPRGPTQSDCIWVDPRNGGEAYLAAINYGGPDSGIPAGDCAGTDPRPLRSDRRHLTIGGGPRREGGAAAQGDEAILTQVLAAAEASGAGPPCASSAQVLAPRPVGGSGPRTLRATRRSAASPRPGAGVAATSPELPRARSSASATVSGDVDDLAVTTPELARRVRSAAAQDTFLAYCTLALRGDRLSPEQISRLFARLADGYAIIAGGPLTSLDSLARVARYCESALQRAVIDLFLPQPRAAPRGAATVWHPWTAPSSGRRHAAAQTAWQRWTAPPRASGEAATAGAHVRRPAARVPRQVAPAPVCRVASFPVEIIPPGARETRARAAPRLTATCRATATTLRVTLRPRAAGGGLRAVTGRRVALRVVRHGAAAAPRAGARVRIAIR